MSTSPEMNVDCIEEDEERETPGYTINDNGLSGIPELIDNCAEEKEMNQRPEIRTG